VFIVVERGLAESSLLPLSVVVPVGTDSLIPRRRLGFKEVLHGFLGDRPPGLA